MIDYTGIKCPVCSKPFTAKDDIVVCPDCGAPYHRECYMQTGACVFKDKHGTGEAWTRPEEKTNNPKEDNEKKCPRCGALNHENSLFCDHCGQSLVNHTQENNQNDKPQQNYETQYNNEKNDPQKENNPFYGFPPVGGNFQNQPNGPIPFILDPMGGVKADEPIDDVPAGDIAKLVQNNTQYYIPTFVSIKKFNYKRFNFCAFLFSGGWLLYRKQYKMGAIITSIMTLLYLASTYVKLYIASPLLSKIYNQAEKMANLNSDMFTQSQGMLNFIYSLPQSDFMILMLLFLLPLIQLGIMLFVGIQGNRMYCKHCITTIHNIKEKNLSLPDYTVELQSQGGVNTSLAICLLVCYMILTYLPRFFF